MVAGAILGCEVAFWAFLFAGLFTRYVLHRQRLSVVLLLGSPAVDLGMLLLTAVDLSGGAAPTQVHALAALYLGFSVSFGHSVVAWADRWFAHRFAGGPRPVKSSPSGPERVEREWHEFRKAARAWAVSGALLLGMSALVGEVDRALPLLSYVGITTLVLAIWFLTGPVPAMASARPATRSGWAPWWAYLIVILGANYLRQVVVPVGTVPEWAVVVIAVTMSAALFLAVTAVHRTATRP